MYSKYPIFFLLVLYHFERHCKIYNFLLPKRNSGKLSFEINEKLKKNKKLFIKKYDRILLMPTLARRPNNRKKPNNMGGNKEEELAN